MLNKNNIQTGIMIGLVLPILSVLVFEVIMQDKWPMSRNGYAYFVAVALNLGMLRYVAGKKNEYTAQGIMIVTFVFAIVVYFLRFK